MRKTLLAAITTPLVAASTACLLVAATVTIGAAAEIKVLSGSAVEPAMKELIPSFERRSGHKVTFDYGTVGGMAQRVQKGEIADVAIVSGPQMDTLEKERKVATGSRANLGKTGVGLFVRRGAPKPDISSVEAFTRTLRAAKSIGYNDPALGAPVGIYLVGMFERLGVAGQIKPKTVVFRERSDRFGAVARGDVEIGFNQISEILAVPDVELVGPLPGPIQNYTVFATGVLANSKEPDAARALIGAISSPEAQMIMKAKGFEAP